MNVLLVDDHRLLLEGLTNLLTAYGIHVAGVAYDGEAGVRLALALRPDVILMDIRMPAGGPGSAGSPAAGPGGEGLQAARRIKAAWPEARIIMLTTSDDDRDLFEAVKSGACGYLLKSIAGEDLLEALEQAQQGIPPFSPGLAARILAEFARRSTAPAEALPAAAEALPAAPAPTAALPAPQRPAALNARQAEVLALVAQGLSYKEAGARLNLSPRTIKYHMAEILALLHLENRAQLLAYAGQHGFVD